MQRLECLPRSTLSRYPISVTSSRPRGVHFFVHESAKSWGARGRVGRWPPARPATSPPLRAMVSTAAGRQRFACHLCRRDFTHASSGAFSGYRWPPEVILTAVRWYLSYPLSARQVTELLAERGIDVSARTVLSWTQTFGPQLATASRRHRRRLGRRWSIDEVSSVAPSSATSTAPSMSRARWSTYCFVSGGTWLPPRRSSAAPGRAPRPSRRPSSPITISPTSGQPSRTCQARCTSGPASIV